MQTKIWAHRGASGYAPENTLEAFDLAIKQGAEGIEIDVHLTGDHELAVIHDETVDRTSDGTGRVVDQTLADLKKLDFGKQFAQYKGARMPVLAEVLDLLRPTNLVLNIEIKSNVILYPGIEEATYKLVQSFGMGDRVIYSSFNHYALSTLRALDANAQTGILYSSGLFNPWEYAVRLKANALHPHYLNLRVPSLVQDCHRAGIKLHPWTVNSEQTIARALQCGVDAIITNFPDVALALRAKVEEEMHKKPARG